MTVPPPLPPPPAARLPDGFAVRLDPRTRRLEGGTALLGGSPLRLLRLGARARALLDGDRVTVDGPAAAALAARLLDAGVAVPEPPGPPPGPDDVARDVTVVVPVRDRPAGVARLLAALRADPATAGVRVLVVDDGSADPAALAEAARGAEVVRHPRSRGPAAARDTGLRAATTAVVAFLDSDCVPQRGWLATLLPHLADPRLAVVAPRVVALPPARPGWVTRYEAAVSALDMGPAPASVAPGTAVSYLPGVALVTRRAALGEGFDAALPVAEDVDLVWRLTAAGWRVRYDPAARVAHEHPSATAAWLRRRAVYGTGAAPLAARHGALVAPVVISPWSAGALGLALAGPAGRVAAAGVLAVAAAGLARRLAPAGGRPPYGLAAALVVRGTAAGARTLVRAATRSHWPLTVAAAAVSPRARRTAGAVAVADAVLAWWPHRAEVDLLRFAAARRLEDLAYGAGVWAGALRAGSARALLPARPPRG